MGSAALITFHLLGTLVIAAAFLRSLLDIIKIQMGSSETRDDRRLGAKNILS